MADQRKVMGGGVIEDSPTTRHEVCTDVDNPNGNIGADGAEQDWGPYSTAKRMVLDKHSWKFPNGAKRVRYRVFFKMQATVPGDPGFSNEALLCLPWWYQWDSDGVTGRLKIVVYSQVRGKSPCEGRLLSKFT
jgi:hypothetical protein